jgi:hypothetical protein
MFGKYHYLNYTHNNSARVFVMSVNDEICGFCSVISFPHPHVKKMWREHRTIILPDMQGIGLGSYLTNNIGQMLIDEGKRFVTTLSNVALIMSRKKDKKWIARREVGRLIQGKTGMFADRLNSKNRRTVSFEYIGEK